MTTTAEHGTPVVSETTTDPRKAAWEADMAATRTAAHTQLALTIRHLVVEGGVLCPACGKHAPAPGKFKIHADGGWNHFCGDACRGDAVKVLQLAGIPTRDAVNVLLGRPTSTPIEIPEVPAELAASLLGVKTRPDPEVYNGVLVYGRKTGGVEAAADFYGTWHISPDAVAESGAVLIADPDRFAREIVDHFGEERLLACGLFVRTEKGALYSLISKKFPVVEPHRHPVTGDVLTMQFRASHAQYQRYLEHKAKKRPYKGSEKFISIKGAPTNAQIGAGLPRVESLPPGSTVFIVEGFKDMLAARTMGQEAYALPGTSNARPPVKICQLLARHRVYRAFDGDDAGRKGDAALAEYLAGHGVPSEQAALPDRHDITDVLVGGFAYGRRNGGVQCACRTCAQFRAKHPAP